MSTALKIPVRMTVAEFLAWDAPGPQLWQLVDGEPQAMAPASVTHGAIQAELGRLIANHLEERGLPCRVVTTPGVIPRVQAEINFRIPDVAVTCASYASEDAALTTPVLVVEILSPNNQAETWANVWTYTSIPSVREILVLRTAIIGADLLRRNTGRVLAGEASGDPRRRRDAREHRLHLCPRRRLSNDATRAEIDSCRASYRAMVAPRRRRFSSKGGMQWQLAPRRSIPTILIGTARAAGILRSATTATSIISTTATFTTCTRIMSMSMRSR